MTERFLEQEGGEDAINIGWHGETETERMLSNFAETPFVLDGRFYPTIESWWQSIKFSQDDPRREETAVMVGAKAKKMGRQARGVQEIEYQGRIIEIGSPEHHALMKEAIRAKLEHHPKVLELLLATGNREITHILRTPDGRIVDSKTIPGEVFARILMELREEFREKTAKKE